MLRYQKFLKLRQSHLVFATGDALDLLSCDCACKVFEIRHHLFHVVCLVEGKCLHVFGLNLELILVERIFADNSLAALRHL